MASGAFERRVIGGLLLARLTADRAHSGPARAVPGDGAAVRVRRAELGGARVACAGERHADRAERVRAGRRGVLRARVGDARLSADRRDLPDAGEVPGDAAAVRVL